MTTPQSGEWQSADPSSHTQVPAQNDLRGRPGEAAGTNVQQGGGGQSILPKPVSDSIIKAKPTKPKKKMKMKQGAKGALDAPGAGLHRESDHDDDSDGSEDDDDDYSDDDDEGADGYKKGSALHLNALCH